MPIYPIYLIIFITAIIVLLSIFAGGIYYLIKYKKTKNKTHLILGSILTLIIISFLTYIFIIAFLPTIILKFTPLRLSVNEGVAPLQVEVISPKEFIINQDNQYSKWTGCRGRHIDWGEEYINPADQYNCSNIIHHTYTKPGIYTVKARIISLRADDSAITRWEDTTKIIVR